MKKFTAFTIVLTILVVVVSAETFVNKYLPSFLKTDVSSLGSANILGSESGSGFVNKGSANNPDEKQDVLPLPKDLNFDSVAPGNSDGNRTDTSNSSDSSNNSSTSYNNSDLLGLHPAESTGALTPTLPDGTSSTSTVEDPFLKPLPTDNSTSDNSTFDIEDFSSTPEIALTPSNLNNEMIANSGFPGASIIPDVDDGLLYKTVNINDLKEIKTKKYVVTDNTNTFLKIYIINFDDASAIDNVWQILKTRASEGEDIEANETNEYGLGSFFMNDIRRSGVAFLTVRIENQIYGFAYPKQYHPQVKNLISLLLLK